MKSLFIIFSAFLLTGCLFKQPIPVNQVFPEVPKDLLEACPDLKKLDPKTDKLSDVLTVVTDNYSTYYDCKAKVDDWIYWYNENKKIFEKK